MAGLWKCYLRVYAPSDDVLNQPLNIVAAASRPRIIQRGMIDRFAMPLGRKDLYGICVDSDLSGYKKISPVNQGPTDFYVGGATATRWPGIYWDDIEDLATDAGTMDDLTADGTTGFSFRAWWQMYFTDIAPDKVTVYGYMYHRTAEGTETLLDTCHAIVTAFETHYTKTMWADNQAFGVRERFVVKWRVKFEKGIG